MQPPPLGISGCVSPALSGPSFLPLYSNANVAVNAVVRVCAVVLLVTAWAKFVSALGDGQMMREVDPIFGLRFRWLFVVVGLIETVLALYLWFGGSWRRRGQVLLFFASQVLLYRIGLFALHYRKPCNCLGDITEALGVSAGNVDIAMRFVLALFAVVGTWMIRRKPDEVRP